MMMIAHAEAGYRWGGLVSPWEIHPATAHFPLAFLLGGVVLDLYAWWRDKPGLLRPVAGLFVAGVLTGSVTILAGLLAFFTVSAHTGEAHELMYWHLGIVLTALTVFAVLAWRRWNEKIARPSASIRLAGVIAALLLSTGGGLGGYIVYRGGAGIEPKLLAPEVRGGHSHNEKDESSPMKHRMNPEQDQKH